jgi:hypothetical protein
MIAVWQPVGALPIPWQGIDTRTRLCHAGGMSMLRAATVIDAPARPGLAGDTHEFDRIGD